MEYFEKLPDNCPIEKAKDDAVGTVWRVVGSNPPVERDFFSKKGLGINCTELDDPCKHASCSMFKKRTQALNIARKLPKARVPSPHLALCDIKEGQGKSYVNKKKHVDFWPYAGFKPEHIVISTQSVEVADQTP